MNQHQNVLRELLSLSAKQKMDRTGVGCTFKVFNHSEYDLRMGAYFPAVTTKKLQFKPFIGELLGFIRGVTSAAEFRELGCNVWNANANEQNPPGMPKNAWLSNAFRRGEDDLGPIYGAQWRNWQDKQDSPVNDYQRYMRAGYKKRGEFIENGETRILWQRSIDQLKKAVETIQNDPMSRRILITGLNPSDLDKIALPPCHVLQQYLCEELDGADIQGALKERVKNDAIWYGESIDNALALHEHKMDAALKKAAETEPKYEGAWKSIWSEMGAPRYKLNLVMFQRSADTMLGSPFNIASYAALLEIMARITGTVSGSLHYATSDTHLYKNHRAAALEQVNRQVSTEKPRLIINPALKTLEDFESATPDDFRLYNYQHLGKLKNPTPMAL